MKRAHPAKYFLAYIGLAGFAVIAEANGGAIFFL